MKYIILCGGIGKRCNQYSLPKPLNYINCKHMIQYVIESIPSNEIYIIYNICLEQYNFEEIIINIFKNKTFHFSKVEYLTRGAVESAYIGINNLTNNTNNDNNDRNDSNYSNKNEPLVFIDNDNIHTFNELTKITNNFIGYGKDYDKTNYSFITIQNEKIINIEEKNKISDDYCCGLYGFENLNIFKKYAKQLIDTNFKTKNEFYFSQLYKLMLLDNQLIIPIYIKETKHIGSYNEIVSSFNNLINYKDINTNTNADAKLRICFDLDNTLVTYPTIPNDYSTVKPIPNIINLLNTLKKKGHEIIIYTARRMKTHNNNVGRVVKDIALVTFNTLDKFNIQYDEIIFGKPIADIYIDDRAINPYINDISYFGIFNDKSDYIHNKVDNNKYNTIKKIENIIKKTGPYQYLKGELYFYQEIPQKIMQYFPKLYDFNKIDNNLEISINYIEGIPLYFLYKNKLITEKNIDELFNILDIIHKTDSIPITISIENIKNNYFKKLKDRFNKNDYYFEDADIIFKDILDNLENTFYPIIVSVIHGDFWFSNIIMEYNDSYKFVDMKGQVDNILTLNGDMYYDYGKLYQSILGYDLVLNNCILDTEYLLKIKNYFLEKCKFKGLNLDYLNTVTKSLIFGVFHSIDSSETKDRIWKFLKNI